MASVVHALLALVGLSCTAFLTLGRAEAESALPQTEVQPAAGVARWGAGSLDLALQPPPLSPSDSDTAMPAAPETGAARNDAKAGRAQAPAARKSTLSRRLRVTAYCDRGITACGQLSGIGQCAAPADIPFGARVYVPKLRRSFVVTDRTHQRFRHNTVDIFMSEQDDCMEFGRKYLNCEITLPRGYSVTKAGAVRRNG
jgi:3D (Asp-Asp-Asp) domain-containing protein